MFLLGLAGCDMIPNAEALAAESRAADDPAPGLSIHVGPAPSAEPDAGIKTGAGGSLGSVGRIEAAIADLDCSRLQLAPLARAGDFELRGHVPNAELASDLVAASQRLAGDGIRVTGNLVVLPPPICGVLETVEAMGLPQSNDQRNDPLATGRQAWAEMPRAISGEAAHFKFQAPAYDAYLYIDYFDSDGVVMHLTPSQFQRQFRFSAQAALEIGAAGSAPLIVFAPPLGLDIAVVIATTEPLYSGIRPDTEDGRSYLAWLQGRVQALRQENPDVRGEWVFMLMQVEPG